MDGKCALSFDLSSSVITVRGEAELGIVLSKVRKEETLHVYSMSVFSEPKYEFRIFILHLTAARNPLKMNITTKTGKSKSTDTFDFRRGQNLKTQFQDAI